VRGEITAAAFESFVEAAAKALETGAIDARDDSTLTWMPVTVDERGWEEVVAAMKKAAELVAAAHDRSTERLGGDEGIAIVVGLAAFESGRRSPDGSED